jgi:hypothetical protein
MAKKRNVPVVLLLGIAVILIGIAFLVDRITGYPLMTHYWPLALVLLGLPLLIGILSSRKTIAALAIPGCLLITLGLILLFQNLFGAWSTWAYIWALFFVGLGCGLWMLGYANRDRELYPWAGVLIGFGLALYLLLGAFFEKAFDLSGDNPAPSFLWGGCLICFGIYVIFARHFFKGKQTVQKEAEIPSAPLPDLPQTQAPQINEPEVSDLHEVEKILTEVDEKINAHDADLTQ